MRSPLCCLAALLAVALTPLSTTAGAETKPAARPAGKAAPARELSVVPDIERRLAQYAPTRLTADLSGLSAADRKALALLVQASSRLNDVFLRQTSVRNPDFAKEMATLRGPGADAARAYFELNAGPWDRLDGMKPFVGNYPN